MNAYKQIAMSKSLSKLKIKIVELGENCNIFARFANSPISQAYICSKTFDELRWIITWWCKGISQLMGVLNEESGGNSQMLVNDFDCISIDAMGLLKQMAKATWGKTGKDLASSFGNRFDYLAMSASTFLLHSIHTMVSSSKIL